MAEIPVRPELIADAGVRAVAQARAEGRREGLEAGLLYALGPGVCSSAYKLKAALAHVREHGVLPGEEPQE